MVFRNYALHKEDVNEIKTEERQLLRDGDKVYLIPSVGGG